MSKVCLRIPFRPNPRSKISAAPPTYEEVIQEVGEDPPEYDEDEFPRLWFGRRR